jgi:uncharacterized protein (TIGR02284 family)
MLNRKAWRNGVRTMENNENQNGQPEHHPAPYEHPQFEVHQQEHEITDLTDESPSEAAERAQHARQIADKLNHSVQNITMQISEQNTEMINDLIEINNDRVEGFEKAGADLDENDSDLVALFSQLAGESRQNAAELTRIVQNSGYAPVEGTSTSGALHRAWIDIKSTFTGSDREAILDECERGEDAIKTAYQDALNAETAPGEELLQVLRRQKQGINAGHDRIKALRDMADMTGEDGEETTEAEGNANAPRSFITPATTDPISQGYAAQPSFEGAAGEYDSIPEPESMEQEEAWQEQDTASGSNKLMEFFVNELKDLLWAEKELIDVLPDMADAATSVELRNAFENHSVETQTHVARLEHVFAILGLEPETRKCDAMAGINDEGDEIISATEEGTAQRDVGLIFAGQKAEHYEIASYGGLIALAKTLGYYDIAELLVLTLDEEKTADALLTEIAEGQANYDASRETDD